jgi:hypothetical protein
MKKVVKIFIFCTLTLISSYIGFLKIRELSQAKDFVFLKLDQQQSLTSPISTNDIQFKPKQIFKGEINSRYNNLGLIFLKFSEIKRSKGDVLNFRLKEINNPSWLYQAPIQIDQFQNEKPFPIGFPTINNSKNKNYVYELELNGASDSSLIIEKNNTTAVVRYVYPKATLLGNTQHLKEFLFNKILNLNYDFETFLYLFMCFFPTIILLMFLFSVKDFFVQLFAVSTIFSDSLFVSRNNDYLYLSVFALSTYSLIKTKKPERFLKMAIIITFAITYFLLIIGKDTQGEKMGNWFYLTLCSYLILTIYKKLFAGRKPIKKNKVIR